MTTTTSIKAWATDDKPREKLLQQGSKSLSNAEILAILLGSGTRSKSALDLAREILNACDNNVDRLASLSTKDFLKFKGIGTAKAVTIAACIELSRRRTFPAKKSKDRIASSKMAFDLLCPSYLDLPHEEFHVLLLNRANSVIEQFKISSGGISGTVVDVRLILKPAIQVLASGVIISHNHPSGNLKPSSNDMALTEKVKKALKLVDITLLDHLIISNDQYLSFADENLL
ncbi:RadC family protein [Luteibaculum oceani]|uniref:DNA repair protein RadC n=1 Tax=Luteibaculum oceani TaxID=1294296 RepID=A0A5C6V996_9FLAO|nr:DNA repair protein RadC [Luteibaculum oceani]TXC81739.1 DNA repair protein RadC [Luteibaculum oceani]